MPLRRCAILEVRKQADLPSSPVYDLPEAIQTEQAVHKIIKNVEDEVVTTFVVSSPTRVSEWTSDRADTPALQKCEMCKRS